MCLITFLFYIIILSIHDCLGPQGDIVRVQMSNNITQNLIVYFLHVFRVAQLVEALRYKPEGSGFDPRWCHCNSSLTQSFRPHYSPGVDLASNRNEYQEYFLGGWGGKGGRRVGLTILPPVYADCHEISDPQPPGALRACPGL